MIKKKRTTIVYMFPDFYTSGLWEGMLAKVEHPEQHDLSKLIVFNEQSYFYDVLEKEHKLKLDEWVNYWDKCLPHAYAMSGREYMDKVKEQLVEIRKWDALGRSLATEINNSSAAKKYRVFVVYEGDDDYNQVLECDKGN